MRTKLLENVFVRHAFHPSSNLTAIRRYVVISLFSWRVWQRGGAFHRTGTVIVPDNQCIIFIPQNSRYQNYSHSSYLVRHQKCHWAHRNIDDEEFETVLVGAATISLPILVLVKTVKSAFSLKEDIGLDAPIKPKTYLEGYIKYGRASILIDADQSCVFLQG